MSPGRHVREKVERYRYSIGFILRSMSYTTVVPAFRGLLAPTLTGCLILAVAIAGLADSNTSTPEAGCCMAQPRPSSSPGVQSVIDLVLGRNPGLRSYKAHAILDVQQVNFPYLHPVLNGTLYYNSPGYAVYDFPHTPSYLQGITRVEGAVGMASRWQHCYDISLEVQPNAYVLHMVPKIRGEVAQMNVTVSKSTGNPEYFSWTYHNDGDSVQLSQTFAMVNGYVVVTGQTANFNKHHIRATGTGTFDAFQYNVPVPTPTPTPTDPLHQCDN